MKDQYAMQMLLSIGAVKEKREDSFGVSRSGWWLDSVWLAPSSKPQDALRAIQGVA
jgi:hypothetical protein